MKPLRPIEGMGMDEKPKTLEDFLCEKFGKYLGQIEFGLVNLLSFPDHSMLIDLMEKLLLKEDSKHERWILGMVLQALRDPSAIESAKKALADLKEGKS